MIWGVQMYRGRHHIFFFVVVVIVVGCFTDGLLLVELGGHHPCPRVGPENRVG